MTEESTVQHETLFGHPVGLFTLFFAEMWERFSYYGMRALLVYYMIKGFLAYSDKEAYAVYGAYTALVYAVGFIGGLFADRLLGQRRSAILGGLLMAAGHLMMTVQLITAFYFALGLLITGNGFFKPNVTTILGKLYPPGSPRRDGGYTIYYMGVNLGATLAPLLCGFIGERYGWHWGFGLATIGMLVGLAVFVAPVRLTQVLILMTAISTSISMLFLQDNIYQLAINIFSGLALTTAGIVAFVALGRGGVPENVGRPPEPALLRQRIGPFRFDVLLYVGILLLIPIFALLTYHSQIATWILLAFGVLAIGYVLIEAFRGSKVERERLYVVLILTMFSLLFWSFFEQAGSSMANFIDRNVDRVFQARDVTPADVGHVITFRVLAETEYGDFSKLPLLTQEQLGNENGSAEMAAKIKEAIKLTNSEKQPDKKLSPEQLASYSSEVTNSNSLTFSGLTALREAAALQEGAKHDKGGTGTRTHSGTETAAMAATQFQTLEWKIVPEDIGMGIGGSEIPASMFQAANPIYILLFGLGFTALWSFLSAADSNRARRSSSRLVSHNWLLALLQCGTGPNTRLIAAESYPCRGCYSAFFCIPPAS